MSIELHPGVDALHIALVGLGVALVPVGEVELGGRGELVVLGPDPRLDLGTRFKILIRNTEFKTSCLKH